MGRAADISSTANEALTEVIRPLLTPEGPTPSTRRTYRGKIDHVLAELECFIDGIPYLSEESREKFADSSKAELENIFRNAPPRQWGDYHWIIPLRKFSVDLKKEPKRSDLGTIATFTFGVLLK